MVGAQAKQPLKAKTMETITLQTDQLQAMAEIIANRVALNTKEVLTFKEACTYTGLSTSALYKKTMEGDVPHYKPFGKLNYFKRDELDQWLMQNRCSTQAELADKAQRYTNRKEA